MSARVGFVGGLLALTALEAVVSSQGASGRVSGVFSGLGSLLQHIADPEVPAIPDLRPGANTTPTSSSTRHPTRRRVTA